jgi:putative SOS response-associated peptidase YedK
MQPIHDRMTTILEARDDAEYLAPEKRPPCHLLRVLPAEEMRIKRIEKSETTDQQCGLFD